MQPAMATLPPATYAEQFGLLMSDCSDEHAPVIGESGLGMSSMRVLVGSSVPASEVGEALPYALSGISQMPWQSRLSEQAFPASVVGHAQTCINML